MESSVMFIKMSELCLKTKVLLVFYSAMQNMDESHVHF